MARIFILAALLLLLPSCVTVPKSPANPETHDPAHLPIARPEPEVMPPEIHKPELPDSPGAEPPAPLQPVEPAGGFANLAYWTDADLTPALKSLQKTCALFLKRDGEKWLNANLREFGRYRDWYAACKAAQVTLPERVTTINFFQTFFEPVKPHNAKGLLTGYYTPEIEVRRHANREFSEPVLALPKDEATRRLPRAELNILSSKVLAYGRPVDVFFMQIQGSGHIRFEDGTVYRAAFAGHNDKPYVSIGKLLVARREMTATQVSKQSIEKWMEDAGDVKTKALMHENPRYIFFKTEHIVSGEGPKGAMGLPLPAMGAMAVDPQYIPYGALVWLTTTLPRTGGDSQGETGGLLVSAQDTGGAIKGKYRGDLYFGTGREAGEKAGVMKHTAEWTLLLPVGLVHPTRPVS